jgi:lipopolysaccharide cholinephosphotransferase
MIKAPSKEEYLGIIREVQLEELKILKLLNDICNKHDIKYSLHGGTLLGAVRHGGFIPWDDDLDVIMDRNEYTRFIDAWNAESPKGYYLQTKEKEEAYTRSFLKIRKEGTVFLQKDDTPGEMHTGVFIDVEPVDRIPKNKIKRDLFLWNCFKYEIFSREYVPGGTFPMRILGHILLGLTTHKRRMRSIRSLYRKITAYNDDANLERIIVANFATMKRPLPADTMDKFTKLRFEDDNYMVISGWKKLLEKWYGDYMELPPESMQKPNHIPLAIKLNTEKKEY